MSKINGFTYRKPSRCRQILPHRVYHSFRKRDVIVEFFCAPGLAVMISPSSHPPRTQAHTDTSRTSDPWHSLVIAERIRHADQASPVHDHTEEYSTKSDRIIRHILKHNAQAETARKLKPRAGASLLRFALFKSCRKTVTAYGASSAQSPQGLQQTSESAESLSS